jgi:hypothetical protein
MMNSPYYFGPPVLIDPVYTGCPNIEKDFTKGNPGLDCKGEESCLPSTTVVLLTT